MGHISTSDRRSAAITIRITYLCYSTYYFALLNLKNSRFWDKLYIHVPHSTLEITVGGVSTLRCLAENILDEKD